MKRSVALAGLGLLVIAVLGAGLVASRWRGGPGLSLPGDDEVLFEIHRVDAGRVSPGPTGVTFLLVLGHDARPGETVSRADAIHLVGLNPGTGQATILNIPRDSYVAIPGAGTNKINSAFAFGGPELMARTVSELAGVPISYVMTTGFEGLTAMVDELGGVTVDVPIPMSDRNSGAFFQPGPQRLNGAQALALSRNRSIPGGDFSRTQNQGLLIVSALAELRAADDSVAGRFHQLSVLLRHTRVDGASLGDLYRLGRQALSVDPGQVRSLTLPGRGASVGGASVVLLGSQVPALMADFADDAVLQSF